jgi:N-methylhydantoinase B/oxoprolinase/acetone carboxylase alpha subunit
MSDTPELDDLAKVAIAAVEIGRALQARREELNQINTQCAEHGAAGCRDLITHLANEIRDAASKPIEIVEWQLPAHVKAVIRERPREMG